MRIPIAWAVAGAVCALASPGLAQTHRDGAHVLPTATAADRAAPAKPASIPFELKDNLVAITVVIEGRAQSAVLDSGASIVVIDPLLASKLGLQLGDAAGEALGGGAQAHQLRPVAISSLLVGPLRFDHLSAQSVNLQQLSTSAGFPIELLIGAPAFQRGAVRVDYKQRSVTFAPSGSGQKCAAPIPLTFFEGVPVVEAELRTASSPDPVRLRLVVDLGTRHRSVIIGGPFLRSEAGKNLMASGTTQKIGHGVGGGFEGSLARVSELRLGKVKFDNVEVALTSGAPAFEGGTIDGSLGVPLWKEGAITFDYPARTMCIDPSR
jgi:hypothetical protein